MVTSTQPHHERLHRTQPVHPTHAPTTTGRVGPVGSGAGPSATPTRDIAVRLNGKYQPRGGETYCNVFTQDVFHHRGVPRSDFPSLTANETNQWLHRQGTSHGWRQVSGDQAQAWVNQGGIGAVNRFNPSGHGHLAPIIEGTAQNGAPMISNAGSRNFLAGPSTQSAAFRNANTEFWIYRP